MILVPNRQSTRGRTGIAALYLIARCNLGQATTCPSALFLLQPHPVTVQTLQGRDCALAYLCIRISAEEGADRRAHTLYGSTHAYSVKRSAV